VSAALSLVSAYGWAELSRGEVSSSIVPLRVLTGDALSFAHNQFS